MIWRNTCDNNEQASINSAVIFAVFQWCGPFLPQSVRWQVVGWTRAVPEKRRVPAFFPGVLSVAPWWAAQQTRQSQISLLPCCPTQASSATLEKQRRGYMCGWRSQVLATMFASCFVLGQMTSLSALPFSHP